MIDLSAIIKHIGLSEEHAKIYKALLKHGRLRIIEIAKETAIPRTSCYEYIPNLEEKGLVESINIKKSKFYKATSPQVLLNLLYNQKTMLDFDLKRFEMEFDELMEQYGNNSKSFQVEFVDEYERVIEEIKQMNPVGEWRVSGVILKKKLEDNDILAVLRRILRQKKRGLRIVGNEDMLKLIDMGDVEQYQLDGAGELSGLIKIITKSEVLIIDPLNGRAEIIKEALKIKYEAMIYDNLWSGLAS